MSKYEYNSDSGLVLEFEYDYKPGESEITHYGDGSGYPGSSSEINILSVWIDLEDENAKLTCVDILPYVESIDDIDLHVIEQKILKIHEE
jgi:hypothetical protein